MNSYGMLYLGAAIGGFSVGFIYGKHVAACRFIEYVNSAGFEVLIQRSRTDILNGVLRFLKELDPHK